MRVPTFTIAAVMLSAASVTPLHAQSDEEIILAEISHDQLAAIRRELRYLEHRRPETYGGLTEQR